MHCPSQQQVHWWLLIMTTSTYSSMHSLTCVLSWIGECRGPRPAALRQSGISLLSHPRRPDQLHHRQPLRSSLRQGRKCYNNLNLYMSFLIYLLIDSWKCMSWEWFCLHFIFPVIIVNGRHILGTIDPQTLTTSVTHSTPPTVSKWKYNTTMSRPHPQTWVVSKIAIKEKKLSPVRIKYALIKYFALKVLPRWNLNVWT